MLSLFIRNAEPELLAALNDRCAELDSLSSEFWIMVAALKVRKCFPSCKLIFNLNTFVGLFNEGGTSSYVS